MRRLPGLTQTSARFACSAVISARMSARVCGRPAIRERATFDDCPCNCGRDSFSYVEGELSEKKSRSSFAHGFNARHWFREILFPLLRHGEIISRMSRWVFFTAPVGGISYIAQKAPD